MTFPVTWERPHWKPERGSLVLEREKDRRDAKAHEIAVAKEVKKRDGRCRWPEKHVCRFGLEAAHIVNKSAGGATSSENEISLCGWIHRRGPESIHGQQLKVEKETPAGAGGPCSFWRQTGAFDALGQPTYYMVARERAIGTVERD